MAIHFEKIQYCDLDWKAKQIATDTFPGWKVTWLKKQKKVLEQQNPKFEKGLKQACQGSSIEKPDLKQLKAEVTSTSWVPRPEVSATSQTSLNMQGIEQHHSHNLSLLQPNKPSYNFSVCHFQIQA
ncbi:hypothetical protein CVT25_012946 [Psilocybe cyanescens]|uniref:Uncharacterized protein n=1 Tax=Psilocybe cyanescens TaxID=93625 RepID=A0A409XT37_PSICY|nr:hypothetical protein CVT25_012946 [Psilocybe cyanescens]